MQMDTNVGESDQTATPRARRALPIALIVLATVVGIASVLALWVKRQALETETWTETSTELLQDATIREAVADFVVAALYDNVDVEGEIATALPPELQRLAGPISGALRSAATTVANEALQRPRVQAVWEDANRAAHEKLLALLDDEAQFVSTAGGVVTLDLSEIVGQVAAELGISADVASKLPPQAAQIEILESDQLEAAQSGVKLLRTLAWVLAAITLALFALAIFLARGRRRETLRTVGLCFVIIGALALLARNAGGNAITSALTSTAAAEPPVAATWEIGTSLLRETGQSLIVYGLVIVIAAWLAGATAFATSIRGAITPYLRQPAIAFGALAVLLALLFWWDPVVATSRLIPSLLLVLFLALGVEALRRQVIREFPDRVRTGSAQGIAQAIADRMREARERRAATPATAPIQASPEESRVDQLERLARLRESGVLTEEELAAEKQRILAGG